MRRKSGGGEVGVALGGQDFISVYASVDIGKGRLDREAGKQQEAYLYAGKQLSFESGRDTTVAGARLEGQDVVGKVGRDLLVSSVPDTGKVSGKELDASLTVSVGLYGSVSVSGSVGVGKTNGSTNWVENQTGIVARDRLDIRTENHTQLDGALLVSDSGNLKLDTGTLGFRDIEGHDREHAWYINAGGTYSWGGDGGSGGQPADGNAAATGAVVDPSQQNKDGSNNWNLSGYDYRKEREQIVRATVGEGEIVVRSDADTGRDSTAGLNRDVSKAYEVTKDKEERTDLYVSKSSLEAVSDPVVTLEQWKNALANYDESAKGNLEMLQRLYAGSAQAAEHLWNSIQAQRVGIDDLPDGVRQGLGDQAALAFAKNLALHGLDPSVLAELDPTSLQALEALGGIAQDFDVAFAQCQAAGQCAVGIVTIGPLQVNGSPADGEVPALLVTGKARTSGEKLFLQANDIREYVAGLPTEQAALVMLGVQALLGPAKAAMGVASDLAINWFFGDKLAEMQEQLAINIANPLVTPSKPELEQSHEEGKAGYEAGESQYNGDAYVLGADFLLSTVMGGIDLGSLGKKVGGKAVSVAPGGQDAKGTGQALREVEVSSGGKGSWTKELNKPEPNTIYKVDGNKTYQTDSLGRVEKVESNLSLTKNDRNTYQQCVAGKCGIDGDEGGHLIASIFNGPGERLNLLPMNGNLNKGAWKTMENQWASALKEGKSVGVKIEPVYTGGSVRPEKFTVTYQIGSERPIRETFANSPGGI